MKEYFMEKGYNEEIAQKLRKIIRKENSFLLGFTEAIATNFDYIFRYLFAVSFMLLMSVEFIDQMPSSSGYSLLSGVCVISVIFFFAIGLSILQYRMK